MAYQKCNNPSWNTRKRDTHYLTFNFPPMSLFIFIILLFHIKESICKKLNRTRIFFSISIFRKIFEKKKKKFPLTPSPLSLSCACSRYQVVRSSLIKISGAKLRSHSLYTPIYKFIHRNSHSHYKYSLELYDRIEIVERFNSPRWDFSKVHPLDLSETRIISVN